MGLFDGQYLTDENLISFNLIECCKRTSDMEPVDFYIRPKVKKLLVSAFSRERIGFQFFYMIPDNPPALPVK